MTNASQHLIAVRSLFAALLAGWAMLAGAQVQPSHYLPGWNSGLTAGIMAPDPGWYMASTTYFFSASEARDGAGNVVPGTNSTDYVLTELALVWRPDFKLFGGDYQAILAPSFGNLSSRPVLVNGQFERPSSGLSDLFFSPIGLGWHWDEFHLIGALGVFAPTGEFSLGGTDNTGAGFWTAMPWTAATFRTDRGAFVKTPLLVTGALRYEVNGTQKGHDFRPGDALTFEWGVGVEVTEKTSVGLIGFTNHQMTDPSGTDVTPVDKYRASGIGATVQHGFGPVDVALRLYRDYAVRNGPDGTNVYVEVGWSL